MQSTKNCYYNSIYVHNKMSKRILARSLFCFLLVDDDVFVMVFVPRVFFFANQLLILVTCNVQFLLIQHFLCLCACCQFCPIFCCHNMLPTTTTTRRCAKSIKNLALPIFAKQLLYTNAVSKYTSTIDTSCY